MANLLIEKWKPAPSAVLEGPSLGSPHSTTMR